MQNQVAAGTQGLLQVQQPSASGGGAATSTPQHFQTNTSSQVPQQQLLMASQQQGIRIVAGSQGQPLKIMTQPGVQATIPVLQGNKLQTVQVLQQQAAGIKGPDSASQNSNIGIPNVSVKASAPQVKFVSQPQMIQQQFTTNTTQIGSQPLMQTQVQRGSSSLPSANLATVHNSPMNFLGLSTATSTVVTSTVTSTLAMTTGASVVNGSPQIVSTGLQVSSQATAQAKKSAPILPNSRLQLSPELQKQLHVVQTEIVKIAQTKGQLSPETKKRSRELLDMRRAIMAQGQVVSASPQQTPPTQTVQQMLLNRKAEQQSGQASNAANQNQAQQLAIQNTQNNSSDQFVIGQGKQIVSQTVIGQAQKQMIGQNIGQLVGQSGSQGIRLQQVISSESSGQQSHGQLVSQPTIVSSLQKQGELVIVDRYNCHLTV